MTGKGMKISSYTKYLRLRVINTGVPWVVAVIVVLLLMPAKPLLAQNAVMKPSKVEAQAAWDRGDYEKAFNHFNGLLLMYTRDPLYQYYTGASLVKLERDIQRAVTLLSSAINSSVNIKSVPDEVWFYYGRALQMSGSFSQAIDAYERFSKNAGKKVAAGYELQGYIDQCKAGDGALGSARPEPGKPEATRPEPGKPEAVRTEAAKPETARPEAGKPETARTEAAKPETARTEVSRPAATTAEQARGTLPVVRGDTSGIPEEQFRLLGEALEHPERADSLLLALERKSANTEEVPPLKPEQVQETGRLSLFELKEGQVYNEASPVPVEPVMPEGLIYTIQIAAFRNMVAPSLFKGLFPVFGKRRQGSDVVYYYTGLFRRLDDARHALPEARGGGFNDAFIIAMMDGTQVSMERAALLEKEWGSRALPVTSAFPEGKTTGGPASASKAVAGSVTATRTGAGSGSAVKTSAGENESHTDQPALAGTLSFRAEVMRISKPVKPDVIQKIEALAGSRGLEMIKNSDGETVFLIGNFITFESADDYVSLLIRNGYSEARVAAWVGMHEIPVEAAKELLKKMPDD